MLFSYGALQCRPAELIAKAVTSELHSGAKALACQLLCLELYLAQSIIGAF